MDSRCFLGFFLLIFLHLCLVSAEINGSVIKMKRGTSSVPFDPTRVTQLSWHPRAFIYKGFLSSDECDHLITLAKDKLEKSMVADNESGQSIESEVRTSSGMFLQKAQDEIIADIEARIASWTFLPVENGESMQILHYEHGQKYEPHFDYFHDKANQELGGHRIATVLMYLSDVESGGETVFPNSEGKVDQPKDDSWSDCAKNGYAVKPRKGDALLFFSLHPDATTDVNSLHGSCPVIKGEKWSATKWIHVRSFDKLERRSANGDCVDENENCAMWAKAGECEKNSAYMVGSEESFGYCRKSCNVLSDYGNINNLPRTENFSNSFGKNFRNKLVPIPKTEPSSSIPNRNIQNNCMVQKPIMMEQVQDTNKHVPWDISSQFHAVISIQPNMLSTDQVTSSCSSSSASTTAFKASSESQFTPTSSSPFSWSEFLLTDPLLHETCPSQPGQDQKFPPISSPKTSSTMKHKEESHCRANGEVEAFGPYHDSSATSFVDAILDRDTEIRSQFPEFLHVSFDD
ncbi:Metridin-like ShK toxin [Corchorus olitorius]|uniref:procollagen-proline 4-dioxygenase n=1 Tax=Corchorus olitorius TaxID=93759 RepID=A0A1R3G3V2_9ROSI|nr:Metridin-like ShK toxin [Corchorus olitorius]